MVACLVAQLAVADPPDRRFPRHCVVLALALGAGAAWVLAPDKKKKPAAAEEPVAVAPATEQVFSGKPESFSLAGTDGKVPGVTLFGQEMHFHGLILHPDPQNKDQLILHLVTDDRRIPVDQRISRTALLSGQVIRLEKFPAGTQKKLGQTFTGEAEMRFRFEAGNKTVVIEEISGRVTTKPPWGGKEMQATDKRNNLIARRGEVDVSGRPVTPP